MTQNSLWYQNKLREKLRPYDEEGKTLLYAYLRASDETPYYVGVSSGIGRAVDQKNHRKRVEDYKLPPKPANGGTPTKSGAPRMREVFPIPLEGYSQLKTAIEEAGNTAALARKLVYSATTVRGHLKKLEAMT